MNYRWMPILLLSLLAPSCQSPHHDDDGDEGREIALDQVPAQVRAAATGAVVDPFPLLEIDEGPIM